MTTTIHPACEFCRGPMRSSSEPAQPGIALIQRLDPPTCNRCGQRQHRAAKAPAVTTTHNPRDPIRWDNAACRDHNPEWWFADQSEARREKRGAVAAAELDDQMQAAKAVCSTCPLRQRCEEYGTSNRLVGIWGGRDTDERGLKERWRR